MTIAIEIASWVFIVLGSFFTVVGAIGLVRMPDVFTRMHAGSVTDTLGVGFLVLGMCLQAGLSLVTLKLIFLLILFFFTGPVVTHALAQACLHERIRPRARRRPPRSSSPIDSRGREAAIEVVMNMVLLTLLAIVSIAILRQRSLFAVVILAGIYSFLIASVLMVLDAVDVAMTEASVGAGVSTVILLATLHLTKTTTISPVRLRPIALFVSVITGAVLIWGTLVLPPYGSSDAVIHKHVVPRYIEGTVPETGVPNIVTSVLGDYRGFDTLGETTVIFTAGIGVMLLLRGARRKAGAEDAEGAEGKDKSA